MSSLGRIEQILAEATERIEAVDSLNALNELKGKYLGKEGEVTSLLKTLKDLPIEERKQFGAAANQARGQLEALVKERRESFSRPRGVSSVDPTLPGTAPCPGVPHIVSQTIDEICDIFLRMGFEIARGPNIETDHYNFAALNFPPDHPARDEQDTYFVEGDRLLRTHTTPVQARELERQKQAGAEPPIKFITPGICYRNEAISTRSHVAFHQVDGFLVDEKVTMADLRGTLYAFCRAFFGDDVKIKFRPSYFPFTEPSAEVDISCFLCKGEGCRVCKQSGWLEILGCGMIDPNVLTMAGWDAEKYTGYAFGIGVERPAMLKYGINDIRHFFNNDIRFLRQFG
jgi:phenylalanyl-tRNA synthetase alpha chain